MNKELQRLREEIYASVGQLNTYRLTGAPIVLIHTEAARLVELTDEFMNRWEFGSSNPNSDKA